MAGSLSIRKIYVDSRFKTTDSYSDAQFKFELKESVQLPDKCVCFVDDVVIPHSWYNVEENSKYLYVRRFQDGTASLNTDRVIALEVQNHTFDSLKNALQASLDAAFGSNVFTVTKNDRSGIITVTIEAQSDCKIFTDAELQGNIIWYGASYDSSNLMSANEVLGVLTPQIGVTVKTSLVDLRRYHNVYLSSPTLSSYSTLGPRGENHIIKKVPVSSDYGAMIFDSVVASHDWTDVSKRLLKPLEFRLSDAYGRTIDFHGIPVSFSLIFMIQDD